MRSPQVTGARPLCRVATRPPNDTRFHPGHELGDLAYECPSGSVLITEALAHSTCPWTNRENERIAIFNLYNSVGSRWSKWEPPPERVAQMPSLRQSLFRGVHCADNVAGYRYHGENQNQRKPLEP